MVFLSFGVRLVKPVALPLTARLLARLPASLLMAGKRVYMHASLQRDALSNEACGIASHFLPARLFALNLPAGTHDNQTVVGWWKHGAQPEEKALIRRYTG